MKTRRGFTLVEVLAAMMLMAIVLPTAMQGIVIVTRAASDSRHRTDAAGLAEEKLNEILATGQWQGGTLSGDFGTDWPDYRWQANVNGWAADTTAVGLQQIDMVVQWTARNQQQSVTISTLAYVRGNSTTTTGLTTSTP